MTATSPFFDRLEHDLRGAYAQHSARRRRRSLSLAIAAAALIFVASAGAANGMFGWFSIDQGGHVSIVGSPPALISCATNGCVLPASAPTDGGGLLYEFSHRLGDDLPTTGHIAESLPGQGVFDHNGNELVPPSGAELAYICTTIKGNQLGCSPLASAGATLPRAAAIYILSPSEYVPAP
ncbi:MAG: hypothetical protein ACRDLM_02200 [Gaiellaceae bacterium]